MQYLLPMLFLLAATAFGQGVTMPAQTTPGSRDSSSARSLPVADTAARATTLPMTDSAHGIGRLRSDSTLSPPGPVNPKDTGKAVAKPAAPKDQQPLKLSKRKFNGRHQVLLAVFMMVFVIGIVTMAQQWNPR